MSSPTWTGSNASVLAMLRFAEGFTVMEAPAELFAEPGSVVVANTVAVLVTLGGALGPAVATIVTVTSPAVPELMVPRSHETVALPVHVPLVAEDDTNVMPAGSGSDTLTPAAGLGPALCTTIV